MSSLAAAKADNFYYPPEFDPQKHGSLNKFRGQHPLRERAAKLDQGILVIRFEVPFNIWCEKCGEHIAKGERFNAEKKAIGNYYRTKILQFSMTHHCGSRITIQTDPKNAEYVVVEGARKKVEEYTAADAEVIELADDKEKERRDADPLYRLEHQQDVKHKALSNAERLAALHEVADDRAADPYTLNKAARAALRSAKKASAALQRERDAIGLHRDVALLPRSEEDGLRAGIAFLAAGHARATLASHEKRKAILEQDIFRGGSGGGGGGGGPPGASAISRPPPGTAALAAAKLLARSAPKLSGFGAGGGAAAAGAVLAKPRPVGAGAGAGGGGGGGGGGAKRSLLERAAELRKRQKGPSGVGLAL